MIEQLLKHARKYGTDRIAETAVELGFALEDITRIIEGLDKIELERDGKWAKKHRIPAETRAKRLLGISEESEEA